jgi:ribosomal protein L13E
MSKKAAKKKAPAKSKKKKAEKVEAVPRETKSEEPAMKARPAPQASVLSRFDGDMYERRAKGFSFGELAAAGLTFTVARVMGLPVDIRRRSSIDGNVSALKSWYVPAPKKAKEPKEPKAEKKAKPAKAAKKASKKTKKE